MTPATLNLVCPQGSTFSRTFEFFEDDQTPMDLSGYTARDGDYYIWDDQRLPDLEIGIVQ